MAQKEITPEEKTMGSFSIWHWMIVLLLIILLFATKKLRTIGRDLGHSIRGFKEELGTHGDRQGQNESSPSTGEYAANEEQKP